MAAALCTLGEDNFLPIYSIQFVLETASDTTPKNKREGSKSINAFLKDTTCIGTSVMASTKTGQRKYHLLCRA